MHSCPNLSLGFAVWDTLAALDLFLGDPDVSKKIKLLEEALVLFHV